MPSIHVLIYLTNILGIPNGCENSRKKTGVTRIDNIKHNKAINENCNIQGDKRVILKEEYNECVIHMIPVSIAKKARIINLEGKVKYGVTYILHK